MSSQHFPEHRPYSLSPLSNVFPSEESGPCSSEENETPEADPRSPSNPDTGSISGDNIIDELAVPRSLLRRDVPHKPQIVIKPLSLRDSTIDGSSPLLVERGCDSAPITPPVLSQTIADDDTTPVKHPTSLLAQTENTPIGSEKRKSHRSTYSIDSIPRQTVLKALACRPPPLQSVSYSTTIHDILMEDSKPATLQINPRHGRGDHSAPPTAIRRDRRLSQALSDLTIDPTPSALSAAANQVDQLAALRSPCFFHKRFESIVNIDRVLEEISADAPLSHSRLVRTASGVREVSRQLQRRPIKRAVRTVMIVTKARDNDLVYKTRELAEWLMGTPRYGNPVGVVVYVDSKLRRSKRFDADGLLAQDPRYVEGNMLRYWTPEMCWTQPDKFDLVLTLGGDGTVLFTSWLFQRIVPPVLSFSLGSLGFLTNFDFAHYRRELDPIMGDAGMRVNLRMRFTCTVYRIPAVESRIHSADDLPRMAGTGRRRRRLPEPVEAEQFEVLNEIIIDRGPSPYVSNLELYSLHPAGDLSSASSTSSAASSRAAAPEQDLLTIIQADGLLLSTPTGSTAYSLSAGGSLVSPDIPAILLTPICPHTLSFRPMVLSDSMLLKVAVPRGSRAGAYAAFDGKNRVELRPGDYVTVEASRWPFPTVGRTERDWFSSLEGALRWNVRGAVQKGWRGGMEEEEGEETGDEGGYEYEDEAPVAGKEAETFDIDFDDPDERDSGYSATGSSIGGGSSPVRRVGFGPMALAG